MLALQKPPGLSIATLKARPLLDAVLNKEPDEVIWDKVYDAVTESTPPPRPPSSIQQTPWLRSTSSFANSTEHRKYVDDVLKEELGRMFVGVPGFSEAFFGEIAGFKLAAQAVFERNGAIVDESGVPFGNTLYAASARGCEEVVRLLLGKSADVNARGGAYGNALQGASVKGDEKVVKLPLEKGSKNLRAEYVNSFGNI